MQAYRQEVTSPINQAVEGQETKAKKTREPKNELCRWGVFWIYR